MSGQDIARELDARGFVVIPGPVPTNQMEPLQRAYDTAVTAAAAEDVRAGSTSTRVTDFVNRGREFDAVYVFPPLLAACERIIGGPFKLSSLHARTLRSHAPDQGLHVDVARGSADWPLAGFILMIDEFRPDNGATQFIPGSQRWPDTPGDMEPGRRIDPGDVALACGPAGSLLVFNGSAWHGHSSNRSDAPRRSLQGAFIPRAGRAGTDFSGRMTAETRLRLDPQARYLLAL